MYNIIRLYKRQKKLKIRLKTNVSIIRVIDWSLTVVGTIGIGFRNYLSWFLSRISLSLEIKSRNPNIAILHMQYDLYYTSFCFIRNTIFGFSLMFLNFLPSWALKFLKCEFFTRIILKHFYWSHYSACCLFMSMLLYSSNVAVLVLNVFSC